MTQSSVITPPDGSGLEVDVTNLDSPEEGVPGVLGALGRRGNEDRRKGLRHLHGHPRDDRERRSLQAGVRDAERRTQVHRQRSLDRAEHHHPLPILPRAGRQNRSPLHESKATRRKATRSSRSTPKWASLRNSKSAAPASNLQRRRQYEPENGTVNEQKIDQATAKRPRPPSAPTQLPKRRPVPVHKRVDRVRGRLQGKQSRQMEQRATPEKRSFPAWRTAHRRSANILRYAQRLHNRPAQNRKPPTRKSRSPT